MGPLKRTATKAAKSAAARNLGSIQLCSKSLLQQACYNEEPHADIESKPTSTPVNLNLLRRHGDVLGIGSAGHGRPWAAASAHVTSMA